MANTESDATYCSEVEKENAPLRRRSKRLSQKLLINFRSNGDPASQRFAEIHQMLKNNTLCNDWSKHDWLALRYEIELIKKNVKGAIRSEITSVQKKINENIKKSSVTTDLNILFKNAIDFKNDCRFKEPVNSINILAGMTEVLTELPPYQKHNLPNMMETAQKPKPNILLTQVNPLDLTRKGFQKLDSVCIEDDLVQIQSHLEPSSNEQNKKNYKSKDTIVDLTEKTVFEENQEITVNAVSSKKAIHTSKWLKYLPTQQKPKASNEKPEAPLPLKEKPQSLKQSLIKLYKDTPISTVPISSPKKLKSSNHRSKESSTQKQFKNTDQIDIPPRMVQSEHISSISPDFFADELIQLDLPELLDDGSVESLPLSLKENLKKVFGTDSLNDVLGCEKIVYSLTERQVRRLATALNVKEDSLKRTIEQILTDYRDDNYVLFEEDMQSDSSVVECSQSPPHRLFPSQRSQISK